MAVHSHSRKIPIRSLRKGDLFTLERTPDTHHRTAWPKFHSHGNQSLAGCVSPSRLVEGSAPARRAAVKTCQRVTAPVPIVSGK
eukprot:scaffold104265_cov29-Tisochrysis_lutea.AAC.4